MKKLIFAMAMAAAGAATAGVSFSYQGALKTADGGQVTERNKTIEFRLYETPTGTDALWCRALSVHLDEAGLFNVELSDLAGSDVSGKVMTNNLDWVLAEYLGKGSDLYIGLTVRGSTGEIRPRQKMLHVPSAAYAADVATAKGDFAVTGIATFNGAVSAKGNVTVEGELQAAGGLTVSRGTMSLGAGVSITQDGNAVGFIPRGTIVMWSGTASTVPAGWAICDGKEYTYGGVTTTTPDLRGRFIVGVNDSTNPNGGRNTSFSEYKVGKTDGEETHTLTQAEIPNHGHYVESVKVSSGSSYNVAKMEVGHTAGININFSDGVPHENRPPYYAVYYIIKL